MLESECGNVKCNIQTRDIYNRNPNEDMRYNVPSKDKKQNKTKKEYKLLVSCNAIALGLSVIVGMYQ